MALSEDRHRSGALGPWPAETVRSVAERVSRVPERGAGAFEIARCDRGTHTGCLWLPVFTVDRTRSPQRQVRGGERPPGARGSVRRCGASALTQLARDQRCAALIRPSASQLRPVQRGGDDRGNDDPDRIRHVHAELELGGDDEDDASFAWMRDEDPCRAEQSGQHSDQCASLGAREAIVDRRDRALNDRPLSRALSGLVARQTRSSPTVDNSTRGFRSVDLALLRY